MLTVRVARCECKGQEQGECRNKHGDCRVTEAVAGKRLTKPDGDFYSRAFSCILLDISVQSGYLVHSCVTHGQAAKDRRERNGVLEECPFPVITFLTSLLFFISYEMTKKGPSACFIFWKM